MLRLWFASPELADFESAAPDDHVKLFLPDQAGELVARDYTPRMFDRERCTLAIDFVLHDAGPATAWARAAEPGDTLLIGGPRGSNVVADDFDWYLLLGDETAIPAIARRLEELRDGVPVFAGMMIGQKSDAVAVRERAGCSVSWLVRGARGTDSDGEQLKTFVDKLSLPPGDGYVWIAAEADAARDVRSHMEEVHDHPPEWIKASGYWHAGAAGGHRRVGG